MGQFGNHFSDYAAAETAKNQVLARLGQLKQPEDEDSFLAIGSPAVIFLICVIGACVFGYICDCRAQRKNTVAAPRQKETL